MLAGGATVIEDNTKNRHLLQLFFVLGWVFGFVIDVAQDNDVRARDYCLVFFLTLKWSVNVAIALALALSDGWRAGWREIRVVRDLQGWLEADGEEKEKWEA
ncbi:hypothetical protein MMC18_004336 [Xylographa bjoerkii]|nr:hypothetical protein [Xylographa bjoerkii]